MCNLPTNCWFTLFSPNLSYHNNEFLDRRLENAFRENRYHCSYRKNIWEQLKWMFNSFFLFFLRMLLMREKLRCKRITIHQQNVICLSKYRKLWHRPTNIFFALWISYFCWIWLSTTILIKHIFHCKMSEFYVQ